MKKHIYDAVVIGSGCAGLNAADCLYNNGMKNIAVVTEGLKMGTSRNTGSDKQTYYKQAIASDSVDGAGEMAKTLFSGMAMHGDTALVESANSLKCFFKLVNLGVNFPENEYGELVGYRTDHDENTRATSVGPLTSKLMTEALEREVLKKEIKIYDNRAVFKLITKNNKICGAVAYNTKENAFELFISDKIILATGGCAYLYKDKVYPYSQSGMSGMAIEAGVKTANLTEWQYGLASVDFRWNVSGTYQQVLPRYVSVDENGAEYEFLPDYYGELEAINLVFQKGYQWPFDSKKLNGSSKIDIAVYKEMQKGRSVYMDFRKNPKGLDFNKISDEARVYLKNSNALFGTPIERLSAMNKKAISLYKFHGIDLYKDMLKVAVCAQHQNGGIYVDKNYETSVKGLFAVGEAAGVFGVYRPGGTALNSTQVSSMRAAACICGRRKSNADDAYVLSEAEKFIFEIKISPNAKNAKILKFQKEIQEEMSKCAGFLRDEKGIKNLKKKIKALKDGFFENIGVIPENRVYGALKLRDMLITAHETLSAMEKWCEKVVYRGGAVAVSEKSKESNEIKEKSDNSYDNKIICTKNSRAFWEEPREIPKSDTWFERVYNKKG